jgi:predicted metal-dependent hydrolase
MIQQKDKVKYGTTTIPYYVIRSRRIKTSELIVDADTITVRAPFDKDKKEIESPLSNNLYALTFSRRSP